MTLFDRIKELEDAIHPDEINVSWEGKTFNVYPWVKPAIFSAIQTGGVKPAASSGAKFQLKQLFSGRKHKFNSAKTIIFSNSLERREIDKQVIDKLFEGIVNEGELSPIKTIEAKFAANFYPLDTYANQQVYSRSSFYLREQFLMRTKLKRLKVDWPETVLNLLQKNNLQLDLDTIVKRHVAQYLTMHNYFGKHKNLEYVFLSVSYTNFGLVNACRDLGISVIEMQHGVINREHYGYTYTYAPAQNQYPDFLLTFGERDADYINQSSLQHFVKAKAVGSYVLDLYEKQAVQVQAMSVAISGQDCQTGLESVVDLIELAKKNSAVTFYFKARRTAVSWYLERYSFPSNWIFEEKRDVYQLILETTLHLTAYSSCALEAPSIGRRNILFNKNNKAREYYHDKLPEGISTSYCDSLKELHENLQRLLQADVKEIDIKQSNTANMQSNYQDNIHTFTRELVLK